MRPVLLALSLAICSWVLPCTASAHRGSTTYIRIEPLEAGASAEIEVEVVDAAVELGLPEDAAAADVLSQADRIQTWLGDGITLRSDGGECEPSIHGGPTLVLEDEDVPRLRVEIVYACPSPVTGLRLRDATVFPTDAQHETYVRLRFSEGEETLVLRMGRQEGAVGEPASVLSLAWEFVVLGAMHLITGYDHMLFLLALLLTAGGLAVREGRKKALRDVGLVVTAFTVGHSVTLVGAALGWFTLPSRLVETVIALSIAVVALLNVVRPEGRQHVPWLALAFGLIHGLGFSGVLGELGLPSRARVVSLFAFNVGIELAQLCVVAVAIVPLEWLATKRGYVRWVVQGGSIAIALLALFWMWERWTG